MAKKQETKKAAGNGTPTQPPNQNHQSDDNYISQKSQNVKSNSKKIETLEDFKELFEESFPSHAFDWKQRRADDIWARCPFHAEDKPSFHIFQGSHGLAYKCFGCGAGGGVGKLLGIAKKENPAILKKYDIKVSERQKEYREKQDTVAEFVQESKKALEKTIESKDFEKALESVAGTKRSSLFLKLKDKPEKIPENAVVLLLIKVYPQLIEENKDIDEIRTFLKAVLDYFQIGIITKDIEKKYKDFFQKLNEKYYLAESSFVFPFYSQFSDIPFLKFRDFWANVQKKRFNIVNNFNDLATFGWLGFMRDFVKGKNYSFSPAPVFFTESETDVLSLYYSAIAEGMQLFQALAVSTSNDYIEIKKWKRFQEFIPIILPDFDSYKIERMGAAQEKICKLAEEAKDEKIYVMVDKNAYKGKKDINEAIAGVKAIVQDDATAVEIIKAKAVHVQEAKRIFEEEWERYRKQEYQKTVEMLEKAEFENFAELYRDIYNITHIEIEKTEKISSVETFTKEEVQLDFVLNGFLQGTVGLLSAPGSTGKSFFALQTAISVATKDVHYLVDYNFAGIVKTKGKVLYLSIEDPRLIIEKRMQNIYSYLCSKIFTLKKEDFIEHFLKKVDENLDIISLFGEKFNVYGEDEIFTAEYNKKCIEFIKRKAEGKKLVILDTLSRVHIADENSNADMSALLKIFENIAAETGASILLLHHTSKEATYNKRSDQTALRGASALISNSRFGISLTKNKDEEDKLTLTFSKINYSQVPEEITLFRNNGGVLDINKWDNNDNYTDEDDDNREEVKNKKNEESEKIKGMFEEENIELTDEEFEELIQED